MEYNNYACMPWSEQIKVEQATEEFKEKLIEMINKNKIDKIYDIKWEVTIIPLLKQDVFK